MERFRRGFPLHRKLIVSGKPFSAHWFLNMGCQDQYDNWNLCWVSIGFQKYLVNAQLLRIFSFLSFAMWNLCLDTIAWTARFLSIAQKYICTFAIVHKYHKKKKMQFKLGHETSPSEQLLYNNSFTLVSWIRLLSVKRKCFSSWEKNNVKIITENPDYKPTEDWIENEDHILLPSSTHHVEVWSALRGFASLEHHWPTGSQPSWAM